jgi:chromosome segregation ATPase
MCTVMFCEELKKLTIHSSLISLIQVAFHREIRCPSVTLEGDIFQPSGLLTGGSRK